MNLQDEDVKFGADLIDPLAAILARRVTRRVLTDRNPIFK